jgi:hypothetical protein
MAPLSKHSDAPAEVLDDDQSISLIDRDAPEVINVIDAQSRRRVRPRKSRIANETVRRAKAAQKADHVVTCDLCEGSHDLGHCSC